MSVSHKTAQNKKSADNYTDSAVSTSEHAAYQPSVTVPAAGYGNSVPGNNNTGSTGYIKFGKDGTGNPIKWIVIKKENDRQLLLSCDAVCKKAYDESGSNDWASSSIRKWLNGEFMGESFSESENQKIIAYQTTADTEDKVFLLSMDEAACVNERERICSLDGKKRYWWLRSPGGGYYSAAIVDKNGGVDPYGNNVMFGITCVRPAMWIGM